MVLLYDVLLEHLLVILLGCLASEVDYQLDCESLGRSYPAYGFITPLALDLGVNDSIDGIT